MCCLFSVASSIVSSLLGSLINCLHLCPWSGHRGVHQVPAVGGAHRLRGNRTGALNYHVVSV